MAKKQDIRIEGSLNWDQYAGVTAAQALPEIYAHATKASIVARTWYWNSIETKRSCSFAVRFASYVFLVLGGVLPVVAGLSSDPATRLLFTQVGVTALALAGLLQAGDRIFGWSSGWMRYVTTVMAMESATRKFELDWSSYLISRTDPLSDSDKQPLFDLAKQLEEAIAKLQTDETDKWVTEFNSSQGLLSDLIKSQRETAEKTSEVARAAIAAQQSVAAENEKRQKSGGIELTIAHKADPVAVNIGIDNAPPQSFTGPVWSQLQVSPGLHVVRVSTTSPKQEIQKTVDVPGGGIARVDIRLN